jgi:hypothetical protein
LGIVKIVQKWYMNRKQSEIQVENLSV